MYTVVGCPDCGTLKIVDGRPETTRCPRCGRRSSFEKLRAFYRSEDLDAAREARARLLADRSDDATSAAGERAESGAGGTTGRRETVLAALRDLDRPTEAEVIERAGESGVPADYVREVIEKLRRRGEVTETDGRYRLL
ncbi:replication protein H [Halobacteriales archaeon QS_5_70_17]|nr:MAG: replication protein H [Halobacteriales archaeon QS_5_70_17]